MKVAIAVIVDEQGRVLITQRPLNAQAGGLWEFPGGKVEQDESPLQALVREIKEEVGLEIVSADFLSEIHHDYGTHAVTLLVYQINQFHGKAMCCEQQLDLQWIEPQQLKHYAFPQANQAIISVINKEV